MRSFGKYAILNLLAFPFLNRFNYSVGFVEAKNFVCYFHSKMPNSEAILFVNCELNSFILIIWLMVLVLNEKMDYNKVSSMTDEL